MQNYNDRVKAQIEQYKNLEALTGLPEIYKYWNQKFVIPKIREVFGVSNHIDLYANQFKTVIESDLDRNHILLSIGSGECLLEISIAEKLLEYGVTNFHFYASEISPIRLDRAKKNVTKAGLDSYFEFIDIDFNEQKLSGNQSFSGIMAQHTLHHINELEFLFEYLNDSILDNGVFVVVDIIGRNGHMRWPEVLSEVEKIWDFIPDSYKFNHQHKKPQLDFVNWDCSKVGFEGIRAQDILPLLCQYFDFTHFLGVGGIVDVFVERSYGHNFDVNDPKDTMFLDLIEMYNEKLLSLGLIKPTMIFAIVRKSGSFHGKQRYWKGLSADSAIRKVDK